MGGASPPPRRLAAGGKSAAGRARAADRRADCVRGERSGCTRVHAILKRQALAAGLKPPNHKRVYRVMKVHGLLLDRHAGGVERRHDGRIAVDARKLYEVRWAARRCYRRSARPHGISLSVCRKFEVAAQISRESR